ncbi:MAG: class I SAM-dependent methyltransferase family protein [Candidatus Thorarchaeota archaeon]
MSSKKPFLKIPVNEGERIRKVLLEHDYLDTGYKIVSQHDDLYFPLRQELSSDKILEITGPIDYDTGDMEFESALHGPRTLIEALEGHLDANILDLVPRAYDLIGDIAIIEIPEQLLEHSNLIGRVFLEVHKNFSTVLAKRGAISGTTRTRNYHYLAGKNKTKTVHLEYGCRIAVDVAKAYFSPRLLEEHHRIAQLVQDGEFVVDMFCGVGPFPIHIAKKCKAHVVAIDINPEAINLLRESMKMNSLLGTIEPTVSDAKTYTSTSRKSIADRVIMNHPSGAFDFVSDACHILKPNGVIHYYDFIGGENPEAEIKDKIIKLVEKSGRSVRDVSLIRRVRDSAPYEYQMVTDLIIQ